MFQLFNGTDSFQANLDYLVINVICDMPHKKKIDNDIDFLGGKKFFVFFCKRCCIKTFKSATFDVIRFFGQVFV